MYFIAFIEIALELHIALCCLRHSKKKSRKITKRLSLSGTKISKVSQDTFSVFGNLEVLNLSSNNIALVNADVFEDLEQLKILDLSENDVVEFFGNFSKVLPQLEVLLLNGNEVQTIPASMEKFFSRLSNISLGGNPFHCNCEIRWLLHWLEENPEKHQETANTSPIACGSPEAKNISQVCFSNISMLRHSVNIELKLFVWYRTSRPLTLLHRNP